MTDKAGPTLQQWLHVVTVTCITVASSAKKEYEVQKNLFWVYMWSDSPGTVPGHPGTGQRLLDSVPNEGADLRVHCTVFSTPCAIGHYYYFIIIITIIYNIFFFTFF